MPKKNNPEKEVVDFIGDEISMETSLLASAMNLMTARKIAEKAEDAESLIRIAGAWYDIAKFLYSEDEVKGGQSTHFGFASLEELDDPGTEADDGTSGTEIRTKSRKLRNNNRRTGG